MIDTKASLSTVSALAAMPLVGDILGQMVSSMGGVLFGITLERRELSWLDVVKLLVWGVVMSLMLNTAVSVLVGMSSTGAKTSDIKLVISMFIGFLSSNPAGRLHILFGLVQEVLSIWTKVRGGTSQPVSSEESKNDAN